uniref:Putative ovule protein n=1 Tax=Solanum chacoense TaxID=4108 RepID=A0A0V0GRJ0_SOLCH
MNAMMDLISRMGNARHKNLTRLLGFCYNKCMAYLLCDTCLMEIWLKGSGQREIGRPSIKSLWQLLRDCVTCIMNATPRYLMGI